MGLHLFKSPYKIWKSKINEILGRMSDKERDDIYLDIIKELRKNMKSGKGEFFNLNHLLDIDLVNKHFNIIIIEGTRNIGKTYASLRYIESIVNQGYSFVYVRATDKELQSVVPTLKTGWFARNKWKVNGNNILNSKGLKIGTMVDVNNTANYKGLDFGSDMRIIYWDEFNTNVQIRGNVVQKFSTLLTTAVRHNPDVKVILTANYGDKYNEVMNAFGGNDDYDTELDQNTLVIPNWITGAIIWKVPHDFYMEVSESKNNPAYRASLSDPEAFNAQFTAQYENKIEGVVIHPSVVIEKEYLFCLSLPDIKKKFARKVATSRIFLSIASYPGSDIEFIYATTLLKPDKIELPVLTTTPNETVLDIPSTYIPPIKLQFLLDIWKSKRLFVDNIETYECITKWLTNVFAKTLIKSDFEELESL